MIDLNNWLAERYRVSTPVDVESLDELRASDIASHTASDETEGDRD